MARVFALSIGLFAVTWTDVRGQVVTTPDVRPGVQRRIPEAGKTRALAFLRTELYFGTAKPNGVVTDAEFRAFVDDEITKRFPDGLTVLSGEGQFRVSEDVIVKEKSFVLILLYPVETQKKSWQKIDAIRQLYMDKFEQQSVLRVDDPFVVRVAF